MKVTFLTANLGSGGAERTITYLSSYFVKRGHDVTVVSITDDVFYELDNQVKLVKLGIPSYSRNLLEKAIRYLKRIVRIRKYLKNSKTDVVVCLIPDNAKYVVNSRIRRRFSLITSERNNPELDGNVDLKKEIFKNSDGVIFQTKRAQEFYSDAIRDKSVVIHNAVGNPLVYDVKDIPMREKKISAIGRLTKQKDYPTLLRAFKIVLAEYPDFTLEIFGSGEDEAALKELTCELGISENVIFKGACKDAIIQASNSTCYVMSSLYEGMPNALMEAMAVGLPCISTDCPNGPAELITSGENGILVPVGDSEAIASAIKSLIQNSEYAEALGKKAKGILNTHSIENIASKYLEFIEQIVTNKK